MGHFIGVGKGFYMMLVKWSTHDHMEAWTCGIGGCDGGFDQPAALIRHQTADHQPVECQVCGETVPAGFFGIRHAFRQHNRAKFVRAYEADSEAVREREEVLDLIEANLDVAELRTRMDVPGEEAVASADD